MAKRKNPKDALVLPGANPDAVRADLERRRSGAAGGHDSRPRRQRTRSAAKRDAMGGW